MNGYTFYLWKFGKTDGAFTFFQQGELPEAGYSSLYGVTEADAAALADAGSYAGFRGVVHNDKLWIDADTDEDSAAIEARLQELGLAYEKWFTGRRGHHYGIPRKAQPSHQLPALDKQWCEENTPQADLKLYSHLHLFRRPGHMHEETKRKKVLLYVREGRELDFTAYELKQAPARPAVERLITNSIFNDADIMNLTVPYKDGNRHRMFLILASRLCDRGENFEFAREWMDHVNRLGDPLPQGKIDEIVEWAYFKRLNRKEKEAV